MLSMLCLQVNLRAAVIQCVSKAREHASWTQSPTCLLWRSNNTQIHTVYPSLDVELLIWKHSVLFAKSFLSVSSDSPQWGIALSLCFFYTPHNRLQIDRKADRKQFSYVCQHKPSKEVLCGWGETQRQRWHSSGQRIPGRRIDGRMGRRAGGHLHTFRWIALPAVPCVSVLTMCNPAAGA